MAPRADEAQRAALSDWVPSDETVKIGLRYQEVLAAIAVRRRSMGGAQLQPKAYRYTTPEVAYLVHRNGAVRDPSTAAGDPPPLAWASSADLKSEWVAYALSTLDAEYQRASNSSGPVESLRPCAVSSNNAALDDALRLLDEHWPAMSAEIRCNVRVVVPATGDRFMSASLVATFGAIYIHEKLTTNRLSVLETLVHEGSHHAFETRLAFDPHMTNSTVIVASPLRPDPRPLRGVLHAVFVTVRQLTAFTLISTSLKDADARHVMGRIEDSRARLATGLNILQENAEWTDVGRDLFQSITATAHAGGNGPPPESRSAQ